ncbi:uncharacterized protein RHOBADRAFT_45861 [Rhodotorula graminis WP1]|uniref:Ribokinase n=1 Tax=Rhodotorula graminis (strain WP1) TaxID=578459 RepID=A0A0P9GJR6_RHOGW|nr:uncharacterized protein RHOBADRAFT_45861 [Rhodotorula graminis WP1]KPV73294.1 hypothetical protein RHOBADRAFT_45861 [Rhodotorula graminis WP1]
MAEPLPRRARLLVRGSINVDEFFVVDHIVRSGETIASTDYSRRAGGKGANQAAGATVDFAGVIGHDGEWLKETLEGYGVGLSLLETDQEVPTGRAVIQLSSSTADNSIVLLPGANFSGSASPHPRLPSSALSSYTHLLLQNEIPLAETKRTLHEAHAAGLVTLFNPSPMLSRADLAAFEWPALDWLVINAGEAEDLLVALASDETAATARAGGPDALLAALRETSLRSLAGIIMTRGGDGVLVDLRGGTRLRLGPGKVVGEVKDTTGAGDCFTGYFATLLAALPQTSASLPNLVERCLVVASLAAAMCVEKPGAMESVPTLAEVVERLGEERGDDVEEVVAMVEAARANE